MGMFKTFHDTTLRHTRPRPDPPLPVGKLQESGGIEGCLVTHRFSLHTCAAPVLCRRVPEEGRAKRVGTRPVSRSQLYPTRGKTDGARLHKKTGTDDDSFVPSPVPFPSPSSPSPLRSRLPVLPAPSRLARKDGKGDICSRHKNEKK
jgi:hypothetical protein